MFTLVIRKSDKVILQARFDNSTANKMPVEEVLRCYCEGTGVDSSTVEAVETEFTKFDLEIDKFIFKDGQVQINPNWVEPTVVDENSAPAQ